MAEPKSRRETSGPRTRTRAKPDVAPPDDRRPADRSSAAEVAEPGNGTDDSTRPLDATPVRDEETRFPGRDRTPPDPLPPAPAAAGPLAATPGWATPLIGPAVQAMLGTPLVLLEQPTARPTAATRDAPAAIGRQREPAVPPVMTASLSAGCRPDGPPASAAPIRSCPLPACMPRGCCPSGPPALPPGGVASAPPAALLS